MTIPEVTDALSRHWCQPSVSDIELTDSTATMSKATYDQLANYALSIPTGVYAGKMWRADETFCWFGPIENGQCAINRRRIELAKTPVAETFADRIRKANEAREAGAQMRKTPAEKKS